MKATHIQGLLLLIGAVACVLGLHKLTQELIACTTELAALKVIGRSILAGLFLFVVFWVGHIGSRKS